jgi:hypothetical protein
VLPPSAVSRVSSYECSLRLLAPGWSSKTPLSSIYERFDCIDLFISSVNDAVLSDLRQESVITRECKLWRSTTIAINLSRDGGS